MASGDTTTSQLQDSIPTIVASARQVAEYEGVMQQLVSKESLDPNTGLSWKEVDFAKLTAGNVTETTELNNPQQLSDTAFSVTPTVTAIHTVVLDRVRERLSKNAVNQIGGLAQNAIERKKDQDGLTQLDAASTSLPGAGKTLTVGNIAAYHSRVAYGGGNEPSNPPFFAVLHSYQIKDLYDDVTAGVGTYNIPEGRTARVFEEGWRGNIDGVQIFADDLLTINSSTDDVKGGLFAKRALVLVQGRPRRPIPLRNEKLGGGADELIIYDEYAYGERSSGNWLIEVMSDASAPTS